jgi:dolichol-phosphate mannosyltransferase
MLLIAIATYNEIENLPALVDAIFSQLPDAHILVVDDQSPDGTGAWCERYAATDARLRCLHRAGKLGLGSATIAGLRHGIDHGYRYVVTMDADLSHDPRDLPRLVAAMEADPAAPLDVAIGSRYVAGGGVQGWPLRRRWMSRAINRFARWWLRLPVRDTSGAFRCYRTEALARLDLERLRSQGYSVFEELLWQLARHGARMAELPITFVDRRRGQSKITLREAIRSLAQIVSLK